MENLEKSCTYLDYRPASRCLRQVTWYEQLKFSCIMLCYKIFSVNFPYFTNYRLDNPQKPYSITTTSLKKMSIENMRKRRPIKTNKRKKEKQKNSWKSEKKTIQNFFKRKIETFLFDDTKSKRMNEEMTKYSAKYYEIVQNSVKFYKVP